MKRIFFILSTIFSLFSLYQISNQLNKPNDAVYKENLFIFRDYFNDFVESRSRFAIDYSNENEFLFLKNYPSALYPEINYFNNKIKLLSTDYYVIDNGKTYKMSNAPEEFTHREYLVKCKFDFKDEKEIREASYLFHYDDENKTFRFIQSETTSTEPYEPTPSEEPVEK